ncbi:MAG TPA: hypothetical protein VH855_11165 [Acetobacteraceae bacterium]|jgi:hypothetical protein
MKRLVSLIVVFHVGASAFAAPPPEADGRFRDWFRSLTLPGSPNVKCCSIADCRMVEARWNQQTQHYEAKVLREAFSNALQHSPLYQGDNEAFQAAREIWLRNWIVNYGDTPEIWIEIPESRVNQVHNPTGRAVLCWSIFYGDFNGVFCFVPFSAAENEGADRAEAQV